MSSKNDKLIKKEFNAWAKTFKKAAKLIIQGDTAAFTELENLTNFSSYDNHKPYFRFALQGARSGQDWAIKSGHDEDVIFALINDDEKMQTFFNNWFNGDIEHK